MKPVRHVVSVSGGKDSTALLLLAMQRCPKGSVVPIFCDTGHEHAEVYDYLCYLEQALDIPVVRLRADFSEQIAAKRRFIARDRRQGRDDRGRKVRWTNKAKRRALAALRPTGIPFLDLCLWKGRFPSRKAQFCTEELKRNPAVEYQLSLVDAGYRVVSWQGVRRDESINRRNAKRAERVGPSLRIFRPLLDWSAADVFAFAKMRGIQPNPLYCQGMSRVGCMPCINAGKVELREINVRFPSYFDEIAAWEALVSEASKHGFSTFFNKELHIKGSADRRVHAANNVTAVISWANTSRGGRQQTMSWISPTACSSQYGLCE